MSEDDKSQQPSTDEKTLLKMMAEKDPQLYIRGALASILEVEHEGYTIIKDAKHVAELWESRIYTNKELNWMMKTMVADPAPRLMGWKLTTEKGDLVIVVMRGSATSLNVAGYFACNCCKKAIILSRSMATFYAGIGLGTKIATGKISIESEPTVDQEIDKAFTMLKEIMKNKFNKEDEGPAASTLSV